MMSGWIFYLEKIYAKNYMYFCMYIITNKMTVKTDKNY